MGFAVCKVFLLPLWNQIEILMGKIHFRYKGYRFWRSFTTGKPQSMGGIPHDIYGMTTRSVHRYVLGSLKKLGLDESQVNALHVELLA